MGGGRFVGGRWEVILSRVGTCILGSFWGFIKGVKFMVMELVSGLSVAIHSDSRSFQARASLSQDGCQ